MKKIDQNVVEPTIKRKGFIQKKYDEFMEPAKVFRRKRKYSKFFGSFFRYLFLLGLCFVIYFQQFNKSYKR